MPDYKSDMSMKEFFTTFLDSEDGAVTVDWVVMTAAVVGLGFGIITVFANGNSTLADSLSSTVSSITPDAGAGE